MEYFLGYNYDTYRGLGDFYLQKIIYTLNNDIRRVEANVYALIYFGMTLNDTVRTVAGFTTSQ